MLEAPLAEAARTPVSALLPPNTHVLELDSVAGPVPDAVEALAPSAFELSCTHRFTDLALADVCARDGALVGEASAEPAAMWVSSSPEGGWDVGGLVRLVRLDELLRFGRACRVVLEGLHQ